MLVGKFNVVKVESVPLNLRKFSAATIAARRQGVRSLLGHPGEMRYFARAGGAALALTAVVSVVTPAPALADADEDQVRAVLSGMNGSYNLTDFGGFASHLCDELLHSASFAADWFKSRSTDGPTRITVNSVQVIGDDAIANVRFEAANRKDSKTLDVEFLREGAEWKACRYRSGQTV
jgi:hypothetical protein